MLIFADNSFVILSHSAPLCKSFTSFWQIIDRTLLFGHNGKAVILSGGKEVYHGRFGYCICCICHSKYNCLLYLQVAGQVLIITASLNKKPGAATPGFCFWCTIQNGYTAALLCFYYTLIKNKSKPFYSSANNLL